jgi:ketosteroid isomerase-like protein
MKKGAVLLLLLLPIIIVACGGVSATKVERELYSKLDKGDVTGALALIADDAVFDIPGCPQGGCKGKEAIKSAFEGVVAQHPRHTIKSSKDSKNTATSQVEDELDLAKAAGVQRVVLKANLEVKGGKIVRYRAQFDTSDQQTATAANFQRLSGIHQRVLDAASKGDIPAVMANYTDAAEFRGAPTCRPDPCVGKAAIQKRFEEQQRAGTRVTIVGTQVSGNTLTTRAEVRNESIASAGVERIISVGTVTFEGDKIARQVLENDTSDPQTATFANFQRLSGLLRQHYDAANKGDVAAAAAFFTADATLVRGGCNPQAPCVGTAAIQRQLEREPTLQFRYSVINVQVSGDTVTGRAEFRNINIKNAGQERVIENFTATFRGDKISRLAHALDLSDSQTAAFANFRRMAVINSRYTDALSIGNVAEAMAALTEDAVVEGYGLCAAAPCASKATIQKEVERQVADKTKIATVGGTARVTGATWTGRVEVRSDSIKTAGVERIIVAATVEAKGDKASLIRWVLDAADPQTATYLKSQAK